MALITNLRLEQGEAEKSIFGHTPEEIEEIGSTIFERVLVSSLSLGRIPVVGAEETKILMTVR